MPMTRQSIAYHLVPAAAWEAAPTGEAFRPASLATEGFVHLTHEMADLVEVADAFYRGAPGPHIVLTIALGRLTAPWRYDGDERYPHVYGPLDRTAVTEVRPIARDPAGAFLPIERPDERRPPNMPGQTPPGLVRMPSGRSPVGPPDQAGRLRS